jgi:hypothetical protein
MPRSYDPFCACCGFGLVRRPRSNRIGAADKYALEQVPMEHARDGGGAETPGTPGGRGSPGSAWSPEAGGGTPGTAGLGVAGASSTLKLGVIERNQKKIMKGMKAMEQRLAAQHQLDMAKLQAKLNHVLVTAMSPADPGRFPNPGVLAVVAPGVAADAGVPILTSTAELRAYLAAVDDGRGELALPAPAGRAELSPLQGLEAKAFAGLAATAAEEEQHYEALQVMEHKVIVEVKAAVTIQAQHRGNATRRQQLAAELKERGHQKQHQLKHQLHEADAAASTRHLHAVESSRHLATEG